MYILITNDDGYQSPGLAALRRALAPLGEVAVVAPDRNWSAAGHYRKLFDPMRAWPGTLIDGSPAMICDGTPADCVALAALGLLPQKPDLVVSGINLGANLGSDLLYSGTVAAAMEGIIHGMPAIAVSQNGANHGWGDFGAAASALATIVAGVRRNSLPEGVLLNVNVPALPADQVRGIQVARLGQRTYRDELVIREDPRGRPYYWINGAEPEDLHEDGTDVAAIANGYVSLTPVHMDLTGHRWLDELRGWKLDA